MGISLDDILALNPQVVDSFRNGYNSVLDALDEYKTYPQIFEDLANAMDKAAGAAEDLNNALSGGGNSNFGEDDSENTTVDATGMTSMTSGLDNLTDKFDKIFISKADKTAKLIDEFSERIVTSFNKIKPAGNEMVGILPSLKLITGAFHETEVAADEMATKFTQIKPAGNEMKGNLGELPFLFKDMVDKSINELDRLGKGGNVNLQLRPAIDTEELNRLGYEAGEGVATIFSTTFSNESGDIAINFTPIVADPDTGEYLGALTPNQLEQYAMNVINGVHPDYLNLQIGAQFEGEDAIQQAVDAGERVHQIHEMLMSDSSTFDQYFVNTVLPDVDTGVTNTVDSIDTQFGTLSGSFMTFGDDVATTTSTIVDDQMPTLSESVNSTTEEASSGFDKVKASVENVISAVSSLISKMAELAKQKVSSIISGSSKLSGTAYAGGKYENGSNQVALTGEEGAEIVAHRNGTFDIVGKNGAEFASIRHDDVVFNAKQTEDLLKNGHISTRGHAYAGGKNNIYTPLSSLDPDRVKMYNALTSVATDTDKMAYVMSDINKSIDRMCEAIAPKNTTKTFNNAPVINGGINISCPGITEQEVLMNIGTELEKTFSGMFMSAYQKSMNR